jgi:hypothetical protein
MLECLSLTTLSNLVVKQEPTLLKNLSSALLKGRLLALQTKDLARKACQGKRSSLLRKSVHYGQKSFITLGPEKIILIYLYLGICDIDFFKFCQKLMKYIEVEQNLSNMP